MKTDEQLYPFAIIPVEVAMDTRLTLEAVRVLIALYSFRNKHTGLTCPSRESLARRCGLHPSNISEATRKLSELGWLTKKGKGGHSKPTSYDITVPDAVSAFAALHKARSEAREAARKAESSLAEQTTVAQSATVADSTTPACSETGYPTVAEQTTSATRSTGYTQRTDKITDQLTNLSLSESSDKRNVPVDDELQTACKATWESYKAAYSKQYGIDPLRSASVNANIRAFCKRVPRDEAPHIAAFFLTLKDSYYVQMSHAISVMLTNAEGLRMRWATGRKKITTKKEPFDGFSFVNQNAIQPGERIEKPIN